MIKKIFSLLLMTAVFSFAQAISDRITETNCYKDSVKAEEYAALTQVDFDGYYKNLIKLEENQIKKDVLYIAISSAAIGAGAIWWLALNDDQANAHPRKEPVNEALRPTAKMFSIGLIAAGAIGFGYNLYAFARDTGSDSKLRSSEKAYNVYKAKRAAINSGAKVAISPAVNILNSSAGLNIIGQF